MPDWDDSWIDRIQVGDVLKTPGGDYRVVRQADLCKNERSVYFGRVKFLEFAIRRCSWTGRATTCKVRTELKDWQPTGLRVKLNKEIDKEIQYCLDNYDIESQTLDCCDVKGIP